MSAGAAIAVVLATVGALLGLGAAMRTPTAAAVAASLPAIAVIGWSLAFGLADHGDLVPTAYGAATGLVTGGVPGVLVLVGRLIARDRAMGIAALLALVPIALLGFGALFYVGLLLSRD